MAGLLTANCPQCPEQPNWRYFPFHACGNVARKLAVFPVLGFVTKLPVTWQNAGMPFPAAKKWVPVANAGPTGLGSCLMAIVGNRLAMAVRTASGWHDAARSGTISLAGVSLAAAADVSARTANAEAIVSRWPKIGTGFPAEKVGISLLPVPVLVGFVWLIVRHSKEVFLF
ncbi:MAG TPA: hypothetical protein VMB71_10575 [Acetobacteraceae bacterium]|nr:hypothetical protein [Acetobacteraceae bacterium]